MFNALLATKDNDQHTVAVTQIDKGALADSGVLVKVDYSTINYKDALAVTATAPIIRKYPLVPGIDLAGTIEESDDPDWQVGDRVVVNGWGMGEGHSGGLAQYARVPASFLVKLPQNISTRHAMAIGTAGYTASLCVDALEAQGVTPDHGDILVTGASGGVGSVAVALLAARGFSVAASTGKPDATDYLKNLGATSIIDRNTLSEAGKPLQAEQWAGVVDAVGGNTLANACAQTRYGGVVTACGLAESAALPATVMPFILRGVVLRGVDSVMAPSGPRLAAWARLARDMDLERLETMITEIGLSDVNGVAPDVLAGKVTGRLLVDVNR
ncbi:MAG: alcohol dehydrogenase [Halieaceae bacterium]|nr:alcohol dehydrogenase [Halieaceae bacterium]MEC8613245.1 MDR family oxidoreductase [Pseudomonadota bacterium]